MKHVFVFLALLHTATAAPLSGPGWTDRRPIARVFLARSNWCTPKNPGGHLGPNYDLTTPEGREEFTNGLITFADRVIETLKVANGQGIVVWDVEGQEWRGMVYVGDPRVLPAYAPQIDKLIDPFFARIRDAGYRTGLCLRPNYTFRIPVDHLKKHGRDPHNTWGYVLFKEPGLPITKPEITWWAEVQKRAIAKPEEELAKRAAYARKRWGCSLFYVDTNNYTENADGRPRNRMMTAAQFARLAELAPDALFMAEHETPEYYACTAPYNQLDMTGMTPAEMRQRYPGSFSVNSLSSAEFLAYKWDEIVDGLVAGDALYVETTGSPRGDSVMDVVHAYHAAALRKTWRGGADAKLTAQDPAERLAALRALDVEQLATGLPTVLDMAANDPDWVLRRAAITVLASSDDGRAESLLFQTLRDDTSSLGLFAAVAVGRHSPAATAVLSQVLADHSDEARFARHRAVSGLRICNDPTALPLMIGVFKDKYSANRGWALACVKARSGQLAKVGEDVLTALLDVRSDPHPLFPMKEIDGLIATLPKHLQARTQPSGRGLPAIWDRWVAGDAAAPMPEALKQLNEPGLDLLAAYERELARKNIADLATGKGDRIPQLWQAAQDDDAARRYQAAKALEQAGDQRSVEPLAAMLKHEEDDIVALRMLRTLVELNPQGALARESLQLQAQSRSPLVKAFAEELSR